MKMIRMSIIAGLMATSALVAGPKFDDALKKGGILDTDKNYIKRLQDLASWLFFEVKHWEASNKRTPPNEYSTELGYAADAIASYITDKKTAAAIKEIQGELDQEARKAGGDKYEFVRRYYNEACLAIEKKDKNALQGSFKYFSPL